MPHDEMENMNLIYLLLHLLAVLLLTVVTQIGGLVYCISLSLSKLWKKEWRGKTLSIFVVLYAIVTLLVVPVIAPLWGRVPVQHSELIRPTNYGTVLLNRNYVRPKMNDLLNHAAAELTDKNIQICYLDANFPFFNGFPLLPHISHNDGKKIDISLVYVDEQNRPTNDKKSVSGYGVFEGPKDHESNQIKKCLDSGHWQYDFTKYFTFGQVNKNLRFSSEGTRILINSILAQNETRKILIEPHLKTRMGLNSQRVRYHGCHAVRHDDHIHLELQ